MSYCDASAQGLRIRFERNGLLFQMKQFMLPIPLLLGDWEHINVGGRWVRRGYNGLERVGVFFQCGAWITNYPVLDSKYKMEDPEQETRGFTTEQAAKNYCDRAVKRQGFIFQG